MNPVKNVAFYGYPVFDINHWLGWGTLLDKHPGGYSTTGRTLPVEWPDGVKTSAYTFYPTFRRETLAMVRIVNSVMHWSVLR